MLRQVTSLTAFLLSVKLFCGSGSGVERLLAKEKVAGSNPVSRSISLPGDVAKWLRRGSAKPLSAVRIRPSPPTYLFPGQKSSSGKKAKKCRSLASARLLSLSESEVSIRDSCARPRAPAQPGDFR